MCEFKIFETDNTINMTKNVTKMLLKSVPCSPLPTMFPEAIFLEAFETWAYFLNGSLQAYCLPLACR